LVGIKLAAWWQR